jgi:8-hydroxy-5-deazaflavin:NADPH oxidoreductase
VRIGVIGGGTVGGALAATWKAKGRDVVVSTRDTVAETARGADVVVLAVPGSEVVAALAQAGSLAGKIVVDATNNLSGGPAGLDIAELVPDARYVKAFNTVFATFMHDTPPSEPPPALVFCGDDAGAKEIAAELIDDLGFEPVDVGGLEATPWVETLAQLVITLAYGRGRGPFVYRFQAS